MSNKKFLHELSDFNTLITRVQQEHKNILPQLIEKDYWIMHCLSGLKNQGFKFELKGGTSLSKGFKIIDRFSEDIDIKIEPPDFLEVKTGKNHDKPKHIESRLNYYDWLAKEIQIPGITTERDLTFDDKKALNGGIRLSYKSLYQNIEGIKPYILLEVGFDKTTPYEKLTISSWAYDFASKFDVEIINNQAKDIPCYLAGYTLVEKLSAISSKYQKEKAGNIMPVNFIRHYYDVYQLLGDKTVLDFVGTNDYHKHKLLKFRKADKIDLTKNEAFILSYQTTRERYKEEYQRTKNLYYSNFPSFDDILKRIQNNLSKL
jgi:hypothetical protein